MSEGGTLDNVTEWQGFSKPERAAPLPTLPLVQPELSAQGEPGTEGRILLGPLVGEGGIGEVYSATQVAIGRRVAVKVPHARGGVQARTSLLSEAWAAGTLDHPNVVRVHTLGLDDGGRPMVVMQFIEGSPWTELIEDANHAMWNAHLAEGASQAQQNRDPSGSPSAHRLSDHIRILMQVASAVQHAHNNNILHRDLKTDNVMIGELGKLAVIDWGTALSLVEAPDSRLMFCGDAQGVTGTPACMAPEMTTGDGKLLSEATDVYLLGGMLYELLTGAQPHSAATDAAAIALACQGHVPEYPQDAPLALVSICRRALSVEPRDRQSSAAEFRAELMRYMRQRSAGEFLADAERSTQRLAELVSAASAKGDGGDGPYEIHQAYTRAELGYQQALTTNLDRRDIDPGIERCRLLMARYALGAGDLDQAAALLARLQRVPGDLQAALEASREASLAQEQALDVLEARVPTAPVVGHHRIAGLVIGLVAALLQVGVGLVARLEAFIPTHTTYAVAGLAVWGLLATVALRTRGQGPPHNRWLLAGSMMAVALASVAWPIGAELGMSTHTILILEFLGAAVFLGSMASLLDPRMWWGAGLALAGYGGGAQMPAHADLWAAVVVFAFAAVTVGTWRRWEPPVADTPTVSQ